LGRCFALGAFYILYEGLTMKKILTLTLFLIFIIGCGDDNSAKNAEPADKNITDRNNIEQNIPAKNKKD